MPGTDVSGWGQACWAITSPPQRSKPFPFWLLHGGVDINSHSPSRFVYERDEGTSETWNVQGPGFDLQYWHRNRIKSCKLGERTKLNSLLQTGHPRLIFLSSGSSVLRTRVLMVPILSERNLQFIVFWDLVSVYFCSFLFPSSASRTLYFIAPWLSVPLPCFTLVHLRTLAHCFCRLGLSLLAAVLGLPASFHTIVKTSFPFQTPWPSNILSGE